MKHYRQGDVLLLEAALPDAEQQEVPRDGGRIVLAYGEVTGHAHAIATPSARLIEAFQNHYVTSDTDFEVTHEEHDTVRVPAGTYQVIRQREYAPDVIRPVSD